MLAMTITCLYWTLGTPHQKGWTTLLPSASSQAEPALPANG